MVQAGGDVPLYWPRSFPPEQGGTAAPRYGAALRKYGGAERRAGNRRRKQGGITFFYVPGLHEETGDFLFPQVNDCYMI